MDEPDRNPVHERSSRRRRPTPIWRDEHDEGTITRLLEQQTAKLPSGLFLNAAVAAMIASLLLEFSGRQRWSRFVGMWAPTLLIAGVYNKLVKTLGPR